MRTDAGNCRTLLDHVVSSLRAFHNRILWHVATLKKSLYISILALTPTEEQFYIFTRFPLLFIIYWSTIFFANLSINSILN